MKRVLTIPDLHVPRNIKLDSLYGFIEDFQPTHLQLLGDSLDLEVISHWNHQEIMREYGLKHCREKLMEEAAKFRDIMRAIVTKCKSLAEVIFYKGNHEGWVPKYEAIYGNAAGRLTVESLIRPEETGISKIIEEGQAHRIGHLTFIHGENYGGANMAGIANKILNDYNTNVVFGHFHGICEVSKNSPVLQHEKKSAKCIGTMGTTNPQYAKGKPNQHQNAFHIAYVQDNGIFNDYTVRVFNGKFVGPNGKLYQ